MGWIWIWVLQKLSISTVEVAQFEETCQAESAEVAGGSGETKKNTLISVSIINWSLLISYKDYQQRVYSYLIKYKKENLNIIDKGTSARGLEHDCLLPKPSNCSVLSTFFLLTAIHVFHLLIVFVSLLRSDKRLFLMCFLWLFNKKRVNFAKKVVMLQPYQRYFVPLWRYYNILWPYEVSEY